MRKLQDADDAAKKRTQKKPKTEGQDEEEKKDNESDSEDDEDKGENEEFPIKHETLQSAKDVELEKSSRTVFLGNVPSTVLSSKVSFSPLKQHLLIN